MANPPLSSVAPPYEQMGYRAAELLERLMAGQNVAVDQRPMDPLGVVARQSTNVLMVEDSLVADGLAFLNSNLANSIDVRDLLEHLLVSRRSLERRFRAALGRTPAQELARLRVDRARQLLEATDLRVSDICRQSGFANSARLSEAFARLLGTSPAAYRKIAKRQLRVH
jgi:LacI family transcriptional regulator